MGKTKQDVVRKFEGFTPYSHQKAVIYQLTNGKGCGKTVVCKSSRQKGKSIMISNILLYYALNYRNTTSICLSPTTAQARTIYKQIYDAVCATGIIINANATQLELQFINGSRILFKSAEMREHLRGFTVSGILCIDEASFIDDDIFYIVTPWVDANNAPMLICSTPFLKQGFFYKYYMMGLEESNPKIISVNWTDERFKEDIAKLLSPEKLEEYRKVIPLKQFQTEYLGEFLDDDGVVFTGFKECVGKTDINTSKALYVGIDWGAGGGNDSTVITAINENNEQVLLDYWNDLSTTQQIDRIYNLLKPYEDRIIQIVPELNSIGTPYTDLLKERSQRWNINGEVTSNQSKVDMVAALQVAFEQKEIVLIDNDKQLRELSTYAAEYNPRTKNVSYNAPSGLNDDCCIALMLAWYAKKNTYGSYAIRFRKNNNTQYR